jgi:anaerobic carbon-monoxide dehydrogenase iron sulfur subunit
MSNGKALVYNQEKCTGCRSCVVGCSLYHDGECGKVVSRVAVVRNERFGESFVVGCDACTDAPCAAVCPTGACHMDVPAGITKIDANKCIGCKECAMACPFGVINMHYKTGKAFKCDLCEGRAEGPVCADWCPSGAITFGTPNIAFKAKRREKLAERLKAAKAGEEG